MAQPLTGVIDLDRGNSAPLARQLYEQVSSAIADGRLRQGYRLPSSRRLAGQLDVSRNTVSAAIDQLAAEGYLDIAPRPPSLDRRRPCPAAGSGCRARATRCAGAAAALGLGAAHRPIELAADPVRERPSSLHTGLGRCASLSARHLGAMPAPSGAQRPSATTGRTQPARLAGGPGPTPHRASRRQDKAAPDHLTPSAQAAIELIARVLLDAGDIAWLESPGYIGARVALEAAGADVVGVPVDHSGLALAGRRDRPRLIFITPSHQYPTGQLMPIDRRLELLRFAKATGAALIEDDYDSEFHYDGRPIASLQGLDGRGPRLLRRHLLQGDAGRHPRRLRRRAREPGRDIRNRPTPHRAARLRDLAGCPVGRSWTMATTPPISGA